VQDDEATELRLLAERRQQRAKEVPQVILGVLLRLVRGRQLRQRGACHFVSQIPHSASKMRVDGRRNDIEELGDAPNAEIVLPQLPQQDGRVRDLGAGHAGLSLFLFEQYHACLSERS